MPFDAELIRLELSRLPASHRIAFCASCCQRMLPNYEKFHRMEHWGDPASLRRAVEEVWNSLAGQPISEDRVELLAQQCQDAAPDTEVFSSLYASSALDAASAIVETLQCCRDRSPKWGATVATSARDTVDMYIQMRDDLAPSGAEMEATIANDPLMRREIEKQQADLVELRRLRELTLEALAQLRHSSTYDILAP